MILCLICGTSAARCSTILFKYVTGNEIYKNMEDISVIVDLFAGNMELARCPEKTLPPMSTKSEICPVDY
jgi:hypothetical protein